MYSIALATHNILRWVVLALAVVALVRVLVGWVTKGEWKAADDKIGLSFVLAADAQLLVGFLLYVFLSPLTRVAFTNLGAAMSNAGLRFFAIEHTVLMILAVVFANLGRVLSGRASEATVKYRRAAIWYSLAVVAMLIAMPWGGPLFPSLG